MEFTALFSAVVDGQGVLSRTLILTPDDPAEPPTSFALTPDTTSFDFFADANPGHKAAATLIDTNAKGPSAVSNAVEFDLTPPEPSDVPTAPTIISVTPVPVAPTAGAKGRFAKR